MLYTQDGQRPEFVPVILAPPIADIKYLAFIRTLPCVITGALAEAAHVSFKNELYGHMGRGKGQKASDCWALPLSPEMHRLLPHSQHATGDEEKWWRSQGINPHALARALYGTWCERKNDEATAHAICLKIIASSRSL